MAYLFDTDAISELLRKRTSSSYVKWISGIPREEQFTSSIVIGELYNGAYRSKAKDKHLINIEKRILPSVTILPYDLGCAKVFGQIRAYLEKQEILFLTQIFRLQPLQYIIVWNLLQET
jgi:predicted nucleic acid-binding protein